MGKRLSEVEVALGFSGRFNPDDITAEVGLEPTCVWRTGEKRRYGGTYTFDNWTISTGRIRSLDVQKIVRDLLDRIYRKKYELSGISKKYDLDLVLSCVIYLTAEESPSLHLDPETIARLSEMKIVIDIDLYCLCDSDDVNND